MRAMKAAIALRLGYSADKRKRRRQHRKAAAALIRAGTLLNSKAHLGTTPNSVAAWHLAQARTC